MSRTGIPPPPSPLSLTDEGVRVGDAEALLLVPWLAGAWVAGDVCVAAALSLGPGLGESVGAGVGVSVGAAVGGGVGAGVGGGVTTSVTMTVPDIEDPCTWQ